MHERAHDIRRTPRAAFLHASVDPHAVIVRRLPVGLPGPTRESRGNPRGNPVYEKTHPQATGVLFLGGFLPAERETGSFKRYQY